MFCMTNFSRTVNQHVNAAAIALQIRNESVNVFVAGQVGAARACPQRMLLRGLDQIFQGVELPANQTYLSAFSCEGYGNRFPDTRACTRYDGYLVAQILHGKFPFLIGWAFCRHDVANRFS